MSTLLIVMLLTAGAGAAAPVDDEDAEGPPSPPVAPLEALSADESAAVHAFVSAAAKSDPRIELRSWSGTSPRPSCFAKPACITQVADDATARLVIFGEIGRRGEMLDVSLDLFDVRTGTFAGKRAATTTHRQIETAMSTMVAELLDHYFTARAASGRLPLVIAGVVAPAQAFSGDEPPVVPWLLFGSGVVAGAGALFLGGAAALYIFAFERDFQAAQAVWQVDAWRFVQERNTYALASVITLMLSAGLFLFASMGTVYWLLGEE